MIDLLIIADDFTGALDTGVQFSQKGIPTLVNTGVEFDFTQIDPEISVLVINTESRHLNSEAAAERIYRSVHIGKSLGAKYFYKKTDSTLRGNIGSELSALMDSCYSSDLMFIPAYPKTGRTTINGCQMVDGLPLQKTSFADDPLEPSVDNFIPDIIKRQASVKVILVNEDGVDTFDPGHTQEKTIYVFDASQDSNLNRIGRVLEMRGRLTVTAGCAGFAQILADLLVLKKGTIAGPRNDCHQKLVICGSVNPKSLGQVKWAENHGYDSIMMESEALLNDTYLDSTAGKNVTESIIARLSGNNHLILKTANLEDNKLTSMASSQSSLTIARNLAGIVKNVLERLSVKTLIIFGGDTAISIMKALNVQSLFVKEEIFPGVVVSEIEDLDCPKIIITKAGGFGGEDVLLKIGEYFDREN